jgi:heme exporter protein C
VNPQATGLVGWPCNAQRVTPEPLTTPLHPVTSDSHPGMDWPMRSRTLFPALLGATALGLTYLLFWVLLKAPLAQPQAGGLAQKIFYFHVPSAYAMYLAAVVCLIGSAGYLLEQTDSRDALARAGAEVAVLFGVIVLISGPLWAKKAWGVYWTWDPRLTTSLLTVLIYAAMVVVRAFAGDGEPERKFAAALGVLGFFLLPMIHFSVRLWGGNHPTVITRGGGGISPAMAQGLTVGFAVMTLLAVVLVLLRVRQALLVSRRRQLEDLALQLGLEE